MSGNDLQPAFTGTDVEVVERSVCHSRFLRVELLHLRHKLHKGGWSGLVEREILLRERAVGVLLFDPVRDELVMVRQFRVGMLESQHSPWALELVAGLIDTEESAEEVALRETKEESGMEPAGLFRICHYFNSPGASNEQVSLFCGRVDSSLAGGIHGLEHENEDIEVIVVPRSQAEAAVESGEINNAMSIIAIQWLTLHRERVCRAWDLEST